MSDSITILALDPGTKCGYALGNDDSLVISGVFDLTPGKFDGGGMRFVKLLENLDRMHAASGGIDRVCFEAVRRHKGTDAAHVYGGVMGHIQSWCERNGIPYEGVPVQAIKKFATGKGNAPKDAVIDAVESWGFSPTDDNEADAIALLKLQLSRG